VAPSLWCDRRIFRFDGEVFRFGTAMADKLLQKPTCRIDKPRAPLARLPFLTGSAK
jgi:hypothetical protein